MYKVSVIVPVYKSEKYIKKCLESLVHQTLSDIEVIVVNDGSPDDSQSILEEYAKRYSMKIKLIVQENAGVSVARNRAMKVARGKYIAFVDSDDYVENDYLMRLYEEAEKHVSDMVFCGYKMVDPSGNILREMYVKQLKKEDESYVYRVMTICMRIFRREFLERHAIVFPEGVRGEDLPFNMKVNALANNIRALSYAGYYYVQHDSSAMKHFAGLKEFRLPVSAIADVIGYVNRVGCMNSYNFFELCVLRNFTVFLFQFGRKSKKEALYALCDEIEDVLNRYCKQCDSNPLLGIGRLPIFPLAHRLAVRMFVFLYKHHCLKKVAYMITRL